MPRVVLLGPQPLTAEIPVARFLRELGVDGPVATITAGWQEREPDDAALIAALGVAATNLRLHARSEEVFRDDADLAAAYSARQERLRHLQSFYRVRLDYADDAARAIAVRHVDADLLAEEARVSVETFKQLDRDHLERCRAVHDTFDSTWKPGERESVARHRRELRDAVGGAEALVIAGGHVASLLNRLKLALVVAAALAAGKPIVAWSAGAMCLTDRVVLFHDYPPYGKSIAQVLDAGFGLAPNIVVLPDPRRRIRLDDREGLGRFALRMAPAAALAMDRGTHVVVDDGRVVFASAERVTDTGDVVPEVAGP